MQVNLLWGYHSQLRLLHPPLHHPSESIVQSAVPGPGPTDAQCLSVPVPTVPPTTGSSTVMNCDQGSGLPMEATALLGTSADTDGSEQCSSHSKSPSGDSSPGGTTISPATTACHCLLHNCQSMQISLNHQHKMHIALLHVGTLISLVSKNI